MDKYGATDKKIVVAMTSDTNPTGNTKPTGQDHATSPAAPGIAGRLTVVFTTYNSAHVIEQSLAAVPDGVATIVVDNASQDDTIAVVEQARSSTKVLKMERNLGFGSACNRGLALAQTEFAAVVNPDLIAAAGTFERVLAVADQRPDAALFGCRQRDAMGHPDSQEPSEMPYETDYLSGSFLMFRMSAFEEIGFFDENLFLYFEDTDMNLRTRLAGFKTVAVPSARVSHVVGGSTGRSYDSLLERMRVWGQSCAYFAEKHKDHAEGQRVRKKLKRYAARARMHRLMLRFSQAAILEARVRGAQEYDAGGIEILRDNAFAEPDRKDR